MRVGPARNLAESFRFAALGLLHTLRTQRNFRIHLVVGAAALGGGVALDLPASELAILSATIGLVLMAELLNTAIEEAVDLACPHFHPKARLAKDVAAGAVLVVSLFAVIVGLFLFLPRIVDRFGPGR